MDIGKVTAPAARDANFFAGLGRMVYDEDRFSPRASHSAAHQARSTRANNNDVVI